ncbi:MAG: hypothetical protein Q8M66_07890, partial [Actinomycetota bacterium]|nr:hypothetical protein [Actinomycetota bacterium]
TNLAGWGGTKSSVSNVGNAKPYGWTTYTGPSPAVTVPRWTNVATEFSLGNQSRHPVIAPSDAYPDNAAYGTSKIFAGQLSAGWKPGDTMYCSDCHGDSNAPSPWQLDVNGNPVLVGGEPVLNPDMANYAQGPHGASVAFSLRGPRTDWPVATTGPQAGQLITMKMLTDTTYDNLFCSNCHPGVRANKVHGGGQQKHAAAACINCHIQIPHGGAMSRLIGDGDGSMPARYAYNNDKRTMYVSSFNKRTDPNTYTKADCSLTTQGRTACATTQHPQGSNTSIENW